MSQNIGLVYVIICLLSYSTFFKLVTMRFFSHLFTGNSNNGDQLFSKVAFQSEKDSKKLSYQGIFSQNVIVNAAASFSKKSKNDIVAKKIFAVVIEMTQNIHHYSLQKEFSPLESRNVGCGSLSILEQNEYFQVSSGNFVTPEGKDKISSDIDMLNTMDAKELQTYYRQQRKKPQDPEKPGAGLGLIDMIRKSGNPLSYHFTEEGGKIYYTLQAKVKKA